VQAGIQNSYFRLGDEGATMTDHLTPRGKIQDRFEAVIADDDNNLLSLLFDKPDGRPT
jgi:hypothetical protein